jgi:hypothetical protein
MWWWRNVRRANISREVRDLFEQAGHSCVPLILTSGFNPRPENFQKIYNEYIKDAEAWLTERGDIRERHEQWLETVELAILIFVVLGVIVDLCKLH